MQHSAQTGLRIVSLGKTYKQKTVLRDVSLHVEKGEVVALLGPNGAGKTTCFYAIVGLVAADKGGIYLKGTNISHMPMYRRARLGVGYLPQENSIFRGMTVEQNILSIVELWERDPAKRKARVEELMDEFSIGHLAQSPAPALSGGERRRVEIARCLASNPDFVLLDEPFAGVDPIAIHEIRQLVTDLRQRGIGVLITDHNVRETLEIIDRAYILHDGKVLYSGSADEIVNDANVRRVYLGENFRR